MSLVLVAEPSSLVGHKQYSLGFSLVEPEGISRFDFFRLSILTLTKQPFFCKEGKNGYTMSTLLVVN